MHISNQKYKLGQLNKSNLAVSASILAEQFITQNKVWISLKSTNEEVYRFMYDKT